ncbi:unnamed protein product [Heterobilharzia americana]|nr:unnamed protein product [Heterobilharzia americana]
MNLILFFALLGVTIFSGIKGFPNNHYNPYDDYGDEYYYDDSEMMSFVPTQKPVYPRNKPSVPTQKPVYPRNKPSVPTQKPVQSVNKNHWFEEIFMNEKPYIPLWLISPFYYFQQTYLSVFFRLLKELLRQ